MGDTLQFRVLGRVEADHDGVPVPLGRRRERCLFGLLLLDVGVPIPAERLAALLWDDQPTATARAALNTHMSRLRNRLDPDHDGSLGVRLVNRHGGYLVETDPQSVDATRFRTLVEAARTLTGPAERSARLREALALWRGPVLADVASPRLRERVGAELTELRMSATELMIDAELTCGRHRALIGELSALVSEHPYRESLTGQLMLALYRSDRYSEALTAYQRLRERLTEELGVDPGPELTGLYTAMLRRDDLLATPVSAQVPRQLPAAPPWFTGRAAELALLSKMLADEPSQDGPMPIVAIGGTGGVGKTWLALRWAHQHLDRFPDGQLFVNLRGFDPSGHPTSPAAALRGFLDALHVAPATIPADLDGQVGLYRSLVAGRRMLIVLDNARDTNQVSDLLPGTASCTVIVTSRDRLTGLVSRHGAHWLPLDVLGDGEARDLLAGRLGEDRLRGEADAVASLLSGCAGLPLALGIAAARAVTQPALGLPAIAAELRDAATRLSALDEDDAQASLRTVLSWSYATLTAEQARVFALLGLAAGPDVSLPAAAALTGLSPAEAGAALRALEQRSLVAQHTPGRWRMHDLIRLYARELAGRDHSEDDRAAALRRLVDFYLHTAYAAGRLLDPHRRPITLAPPEPGGAAYPIAGEAAALAWFDAEHHCLLALQQRLAREAGGQQAVVWQLAWTLDPAHGRRGHLADNVAVWRAGLAAAQQLGEPARQVMAHRRLGNALSRAGRDAEATDHLQQALDLARQAGDRVGQSHTQLALAQAWDRRGDDERALEHAVEALRIYETLDNPAREASALNSVGWYLTRLNRHDEAGSHLEAALALSRRHGYREVEANTLDSLGYLAQRTGRRADAVGHYQQALALLRELGDSYGEADTLDRLGAARAGSGDHDQARQAWRTAVKLYLAQHRTADAQRVRRQLNQLDAGPAFPAGGPEQRC